MGETLMLILTKFLAFNVILLQTGDCIVTVKDSKSNSYVNTLYPDPLNVWGECVEYAERNGMGDEPKLFFVKERLWI